MLSNSEQKSNRQNWTPWEDDPPAGILLRAEKKPPATANSLDDIADLLDRFDTPNTKGGSKARPTPPVAPPAPRGVLADLDDLLSAVSETKPGAALTTPSPGKFNFRAHTVSLDMNAIFPKSHSFLFGEGKDGILPMAALTVVGATGGMLKTTQAISWAAFVASGQSWNGYKTRPGLVLVVSMEDDTDETMRKGVGITRAQIPAHLHEVVQRRMIFAMLHGIDARLTANAFGSDQRTSVPGQIVDYCKQLEHTHGEPVSLIVFDHARLAIGGDVNASGAVTELTKALNHIAKETGAAVLLLCHSPKSTVNPNHSGVHTSADILGSGAFVDNARQASVMSPLTDEERKQYGLRPEDAKQYVALRIIKSNYSEAGRVYYIRKTPVEGWGIVVPDVVTLSKPAREIVAPPKHEDKILDYLRANPVQYTKSSLKLRAGTDGPLGMGEKAFKTALDNLMGSGRVHSRAPTAAEIEEYSLSKQAKQVLCATESPKT